jgi:hypothetical protein
MKDGTRVGIAALLIGLLVLSGCRPLTGHTLDPLAPIVPMRKEEPASDDAHEKQSGLHEDSRGSGEMATELETMDPSLPGDVVGRDVNARSGHGELRQGEAW